MMTLTIPQLLVMLGAALLAIALFVPRSPQVTSSALPPPAQVSDRIVAAEVVNVAESETVPESAALAWPLLIDVHAVALDASARRSLLESLVAIGESWCEPILAAALAEETDDELAQIARAGITFGNVPVDSRADAA